MSLRRPSAQQADPVAQLAGIIASNLRGAFPDTTPEQFVAIVDVAALTQCPPQHRAAIRRHPAVQRLIADHRAAWEFRTAQRAALGDAGEVA